MAAARPSQGRGFYSKSPVFHEAIRNIPDKITAIDFLQIKEIFPLDPLMVFVADNLGDLFQLDQRVSIVRL